MLGESHSHMRRRLDVFSDLSDQITSLSTQMDGLTSNLDVVQNSLLDIKDNVVESATNITSSIGDKLSDFIDYISDEIDVAKENAVSTLETIGSALLYGLIGLGCGVLLVTLLGACIPWAKQKCYRCIKARLKKSSKS